MSLSYSDITQLCSLTLAISAIGIAIDGIMVPRLEKFRDYILVRSSQVLDDDSAKSALEIGLRNDDSALTFAQVKYEFDALETIRDDLTETFYFDELSSIIFFRGSIIRALLATMLGASIILVWATIVAGGQVPTFCQQPLYKTITQVCSMDIVSVPAMLSVSYIVCCFIRYIFLWHGKLTELREKRTTVKNSAANLQLNLQLIQVAQKREATMGS
jgi:hypothetical protein